MSNAWVRFVERSYKDTDSKEDKRSRLVLLSAIVPVVLTCFVLIPLNRWDGQNMALVGHAVVFTVLFVVIFIGQPPPHTYVGRFLLLTTCLLLFDDWSDAAQLRSRSWNLVVIVVDVCLVTAVPLSETVAVIVVTILWLCLQASESVARFGLYEASPGSRSPTACDCASPPCKTGTDGINDLSVSLLVFLLDFYFTRGFAAEVTRQVRVLNASVDVSGKVAALLSMYMVDDAAAIVSAEGSALPPDMQASFQALVANMRVYKSFLPQSCLASPPDEDSAGDGEAKAVLEKSGADSVWSFLRSQSFAAGSRLSSSSGEEGAEPSPVVSRMLHNEPKQRHLSLLCVNRRGFLRAGDDSDSPVTSENLVSPTRRHKDVAEWIADDVAAFQHLVNSNVGLVDLISGDHRFASFNGARPCVRHCFRSVACVCVRGCVGESSLHPRAASARFEQLPKFSVAVSGRALCGNFGSTTLQRFMVLGGVNGLLTVLERAAAQWGIPKLVNETLYLEEKAHFQMEVCAAVTYKKVARAPFLLFTVTAERSAEEGVEWMYQAGFEPGDANSSAEAWSHHRQRPPPADLRIATLGDVSIVESTSDPTRESEAHAPTSF